MIYFIDGELIAEQGDARVYMYNDLLHLDIGKGHNLWMVESEVSELVDQINNYPRGNCLEIGLGLGIASKYILSKPEVTSLTTIEINQNVIDVQNIVNAINNPKHKIINADGLDFMLQTDEKYDFIFFDNYDIIDEETLEMLTTYTKVAKRILAKSGTIKAWFDIYTVEEDAEIFFDIIKGAEL